jgi:hypothetical protein
MKITTEKIVYALLVVVAVSIGAYFGVRAENTLICHELLPDGSVGNDGYPCDDFDLASGAGSERHGPNGTMIRQPTWNEYHRFPNGLLTLMISGSVILGFVLSSLAAMINRIINEDEK